MGRLDHNFWGFFLGLSAISLFYEHFSFIYFIYLFYFIFIFFGRKRGLHLVIVIVVSGTHTYRQGVELNTKKLSEHKPIMKQNSFF